MKLYQMCGRKINNCFFKNRKQIIKLTKANENCSQLGWHLFRRHTMTISVLNNILCFLFAKKFFWNYLLIISRCRPVCLQTYGICFIKIPCLIFQIEKSWNNNLLMSILSGRNCSGSSPKCELMNLLLFL